MSEVAAATDALGASEPKPLVLEIGTEVRRLLVRPDEVLAVVLPEGNRLTYEHLDRLRHLVKQAELPFQVLFFEHGTELAVVKAEEAGQ